MLTSTVRVSVLSFALGLLAVCAGARGDEKPSPPLARPARDVQRAPLVGKAPPELRATAGDWLAGPPTTFAALKGRVVWLQFNF